MTTVGTKGLASFVPDDDDVTVARLRAAGAIVVGKTNCPEFLLGLESDVSRPLQSIRKGIAVLDDRRAELQPEAADGDGNGTTPHEIEHEVEGASEPARL